MTINKIMLKLLVLMIISLNCLSAAAPDDYPDGGISGEFIEYYGEDTPFEYIDAYADAGDTEVHTLTNEQYKEMWNRINKFNEKNGRLPLSVNVKDMNSGVDSIDQTHFNDMKTRWENYKKTHNNQEPKIIGIEGTFETPKTNIPTAGPIQTKLIHSVGAFNSLTGFYNLCKKKGYDNYEGDCFAQDVAIERLKHGKPLNCVDSAQLGYGLAKEMGYEVKFQRALCKDLGHIFLKVRGKEFKDWTNVDLAASLRDGAKINHHWCKNQYEPLEENRAYLWTDNGKHCFSSPRPK